MSRCSVRKKHFTLGKGGATVRDSISRQAGSCCSDKQKHFSPFTVQSEYRKPIALKWEHKLLVECDHLLQNDLVNILKQSYWNNHVSKIFKPSLSRNWIIISLAVYKLLMKWLLYLNFSAIWQVLLLFVFIFPFLQLYKYKHFYTLMWTVLFV